MALDGKTVRRSHDRTIGKQAIHMVSAWATENRLVLAQVTVDATANEITAVPALLQQLALAGCLVTIDALGCQRAIAQQILDQGGAYVLALKGNQGTLHEDVRMTMALAQRSDFAGMQHDRAETTEQGHGRNETRRALVLDDPERLSWLQGHHDWPGLQAIGRIQAERQIGEPSSSEPRSSLLSRPLSAVAFLEAVRRHWGIETGVHWVLDGSFGEDHSRIRAGHAAENVAVLLHIALHLLRQQQTKRFSLNAKRKKAGWENDYLLQVLQAIEMR